MPALDRLADAGNDRPAIRADRGLGVGVGWQFGQVAGLAAEFQSRQVRRMDKAVVERLGEELGMVHRGEGRS